MCEIVCWNCVSSGFAREWGGGGRRRRLFENCFFLSGNDITLLPTSLSRSQNITPPTSHFPAWEKMGKLGERRKGCLRQCQDDLMHTADKTDSYRVLRDKQLWNVGWTLRTWSLFCLTGLISVSRWEGKDCWLAPDSLVPGAQEVTPKGLRHLVS